MKCMYMHCVFVKMCVQGLVTCLGTVLNPLYNGICVCAFHENSVYVCLRGFH
jgi:uncharacterized membrane protein SpoIIM required for sporulation